MRRTIIALSTAAALALSGTSVATAADSTSSADSSVSSRIENSSVGQKIEESVASSDNPDLNRFLVILADGAIGLAVFLVLGALYAEIAKRLPL